MYMSRHSRQCLHALSSSFLPLLGDHNLPTIQHSVLVGVGVSFQPMLLLILTLSDNMTVSETCAVHWQSPGAAVRAGRSDRRGRYVRLVLSPQFAVSCMLPQLVRLLYSDIN